MAENKKELANCNSWLSEARKEFASELEKFRSSARLTEDRSNASEKRALLEIDRERSLNGRLQKSLELAYSNNKSATETHQKETSELHTQISNLRQLNVNLEATVLAASEKQSITSKSLVEANSSLSNMMIEAATLRAERDLLLRQLGSLDPLREKETAKTKAATRPKRVKIK